MAGGIPEVIGIFQSDVRAPYMEDAVVASSPTTGYPTIQNMERLQIFAQYYL